jgi:hypothetical protein
MLGPNGPKELIMTKTLYTTFAAALLCGAMGVTGPSLAADYGKDTSAQTDKTSATPSDKTSAKDTTGLKHKTVMKHKANMKHAIHATAGRGNMQIDMMERHKTSDLNKAQLMPHDQIQAMDMPYAMVASADEDIGTSLQEDADE